jgi:uncharacterized protein YbaR (Trm112 family)
VHLLVTDRLACPRCGPAFGLILFSDRSEERRVIEGSLGCANCRERYPIVGGVADLRPPPREARQETTPPAALDLDRVVPLAAAMALGDARGQILLLGAAAGLADALSAVASPDIEIVAAERHPTTATGPGVSRIVVGAALPFFDATFAGVGIAGPDATPATLREAARVLGRGHRVVVVDPPDDIQIRLGGVGLTRFVQGAGVAAGAR